MSTVSMDLIKQLRETTQVGMMDCKKALEEAGGDLTKALEILRKKGAAVAAKRADNVTNHGRIESYVTTDGRTGALVETACETDFSANTEAMRTFATSVAEHLAHQGASDLETLMSQKHTHGPLTIKQMLDELVSKICESIKINRFECFGVNGHGIVNVYVHPGSTVGVMVELEADKDASSHAEELKALAKDVCMQIAVTNPLCIRPEELDPAAVEKERTLAMEQLATSGKPANVVEKIIEGKLNKFYQEVCLVSQAFIKDDKQTVAAHVDAIGKKAGLSLKIKQFKRFAIGR
jgi:elongation factor Ts